MVEVAKIAANVEHDAQAAMHGDSKALDRLRDELHSLHSDQLQALAPLLETSLGKSLNPLFGGVQINRDQHNAVDSITFVPPVQDRPAGSHSVATSVAVNNFVDDAEKLFDRLDTKKTGTITYDQIVADAANTHGGSADPTVIAALSQYMVNGASGPFDKGMTKKDLESLRVHPNNFSNLKEIEAEAQKARAADRTLYGKTGITPDAIHLGPGDDSLFSAALADLAQKDPARIRQMITDNHNGTYTVNMAPGHAFKVSAPTGAELAMYNRGGDHGIWPIVLEKALHDFEGQANFTVDPLGFLTGKRPESIDTRAHDNEELGRFLKKYLATKGSTIGAVALPYMDNKTPDGYVANRAYSVVALDPNGPDGGTVTLRNPKGGKENTPDGTWKLSVRSLRVNFQVLDASSAKSPPFYWGERFAQCPPGATIESCIRDEDPASN